MANLDDRSILFIDDEPASIRYHTHQVKYLGANVEVIETANEAVRWISEIERGVRTLAEFDCIVLDMSLDLPEPPPRGLFDNHRTGGFLLQRIRETDRGLIPVVLFSQLAPPEIVEPAWDAYLGIMKTKGKSIAEELTLDEKIQKLDQLFKTVTWLKVVHSPKSFGDGLITLLRRSDLKSTLY